MMYGLMSSSYNSPKDMIDNTVNVVVWIMVLGIAPFVIWRRIRDEYPDEDMVRFLLLLIVFGLGGAKLFGIIWTVLGNGVEGWWSLARMDWWGGFVCSLAVAWWFHLDRARGLNGDVQDAISEGYWWAYAILAVGKGLLGLLNRNWWASGEMVIWVMGLLAFYWARGRYRRFHWYPSGRVGFVFWMSAIVWGLGYGISAFWYDRLMVAFIKLILGLGLVLFGLIGGYKRSGRKARKDFGWLPMKF